MIREYIIRISDEVMEDEFVDRPKKLVRCKDCKYGTKYNNAKGEPMIDCGLMYDDASLKDLDWFCADGKQKET